MFIAVFTVEPQCEECCFGAHPQSKPLVVDTEGLKCCHFGKIAHHGRQKTEGISGDD